MPEGGKRRRRAAQSDRKEVRQYKVVESEVGNFAPHGE